MYRYKDNEDNYGYVPSKKDLYRISELAYQHILKQQPIDCIIGIPDSANELLDYYKDKMEIINGLNKSLYISQISTIVKNRTVVIIDDIICHGETIKELIDSISNIDNLKLLIIYYHIVSKKICLFDIEKQKFTLTAQNKLYYLYFIEEKFLLKIPTFIFATHQYILMKSDVKKHGANYQYYINGETLCQKDILKII